MSQCRGYQQSETETRKKELELQMAAVVLNKKRIVELGPGDKRLDCTFIVLEKGKQSCLQFASAVVCCGLLTASICVLDLGVVALVQFPLLQPRKESRL